MDKKRYKTVDEYLRNQPEIKRQVLNQIRNAVKEAAPDAEEVISYNMPAYKFKGMLLYFAAHTNHLGFYPFTSAIKSFGKELANYETSRGTVQFPYDKKLPVSLIKKIIKFRVKENLAKAEAKKLKK